MSKLARNVAAVGLLVASTFTVNPAVAQDNAVLSVVHGVPGLTVDVCVNDAITVPGFTPGSVTTALELPAGTYTVEVFPAGIVDCSGTPAIGPVDLPLMAGVNYTAVAHLDAAGAPTATLFTNDTSPAGAGEGKATVRHTAANAEGVEVVVNGSISLGTFNNGEELGPAALAAGTYSAEVKVGDTVVPPTPVDFPVTEGDNTIVYAYGDPAAEPSTFAVVGQVVPLDSGSTPSQPAAGIPTLGTIGVLLMIAALLVGARRFV